MSTVFTEGASRRRPERARLGDLLIKQKLIAQDQLASALEMQARSGRKLGKILIELGFVTDDQIAETLAKQLNLPYVDLKYFKFNASAVKKLPEAHARKLRALVLEEQSGACQVGMVDPTDLFAYDELSRLLKQDLVQAVVSDSQLTQSIDRLYRRTEQISSLARELRADLGETIDFAAPGLALAGEDAPVVKMLQSVFEDATQVPIHLQSGESMAHAVIACIALGALALAGPWRANAQAVIDPTRPPAEFLVPGGIPPRTLFPPEVQARSSFCPATERQSQ